MIGLFNDCFPPVMDGVAVTVHNYAKWLPRYGQQACVATPRVPGTDYSGMDCEVLPYFSLPMPRRKPYRMGVPQVDMRFMYKMWETDFGLVHAHSPFSSGRLALDVARSRKIPLIATFHSKYKQDIERYVPNKFVVNLLIRRIVDFFNQADEVWIPQPSVIETLREYGYKGHCEVVENGCDFSVPYSSLTKDVCRRSLKLFEDKPVLLFVGQHILEKNVIFLIDALSKVKTDFTMLFVGDGYAAQEMKREVHRMGLDERVRFAGKICDRDRLMQYYAAADLFLFPSLYDNAPLVVREAAAMHTPSLMAEGATSAEVIRDGVNGYVAEQNIESFARRVDGILSDRAQLEKVGANACDTIVRKWSSVVEEVSDRYESLLRRYFHDVFYVSPNMAIS
jgi:1,2-diacylglycerol 3-alpha-glucosyltransferase